MNSASLSSHSWMKRSATCRASTRYPVLKAGWPQQVCRSSNSISQPARRKTSTVLVPTLAHIWSTMQVTNSPTLIADCRLPIADCWSLSIIDTASRRNAARSHCQAPGSNGSITINRQSAIANRQYSECDYSLDVSGRVDVRGQSSLHRFKRSVTVGDEWSDIDSFLFDELQRAHVRRRPAV